jgi:hypothetical protein
MQTHRLAIELNSSADLSKSTPDGDEDLFLRHGPSSRRPIRVTVEGRLAAATISMDGRQGLPHTCPSQYPSGSAQRGGRLSFVPRHRLAEVCQFRHFDAKRSL